jgi:hypothetical protein
MLVEQLAEPQGGQAETLRLRGFHEDMQIVHTKHALL